MEPAVLGRPRREAESFVLGVGHVRYGLMGFRVWGCGFRIWGQFRVHGMRAFGDTVLGEPATHRAYRMIHWLLYRYCFALGYLRLY